MLDALTVSLSQTATDIEQHSLANLPYPLPWLRHVQIRHLFTLSDRLVN